MAGWETNSNRLHEVSYGNKALPCSSNLHFGSWNVECLTDTKLYQLCSIMGARALAFICLQETRIPDSGSRILDNGYTLITSGSDDGKKSYAGVGFLIAPWVRRSIFSFKAISDRLCYMKLRVHGGKATFINVYAPHGGHDYDLRRQYYNGLREVVSETSSYGMKAVVGDFNARIHNDIGGENEVFGQYCFGNKGYNPEGQPDTNRELLLELCVATGLCVANTFIENAVEKQITYHELWASPMEDISWKRFAQLDHVLIPRGDLWQIRQIQSDRQQALASHHFLMEVAVDIQMERSVSSSKHVRYDLGALQQNGVKDAFANRFAVLAHECITDDGDCDVLVNSLCDCFDQAAAAALPVLEVRPQRPWIQSRTLQKISARNEARKAGQRDVELQLNREIRKYAKDDRSCWLNGLLSSGSWGELKRLKKNTRINIGCRKLQDANGRIVESFERSETFAEHLESVQWAVRPLAEVCETRHLGPILETSAAEISAAELEKAIKQLKNNRAAVQVPAEYLKAVIEVDLQRDGWLLSLMRLCWNTKTTPKSWHISEVIPVYKKGSPTDCRNYRPISLVSVLYKVYTTILLNRLKDAGSESRLWSRQFGFKTRSSTEDALFIVRRRIEQALTSRGGRASLLALDWKAAFDCIAPQRLMLALRRFGLNESMIDAVKEIYNDRHFHVRDEGVQSSNRPQRAGISQGCPLSPFLFGILMTVLMTDARSKLGNDAKTAYDRHDLEDVLFADDTLLISNCGRHMEEYMNAVMETGAEYGLQIHWGKVQLVQVCTDQPVHAHNGDRIKAQESMLYLGSTIHGNGRFGCEVGRKIGAAAGDFKALQRVWKHAAISRDRKLQLYDSLIQSKLRYAVASAWLLKADLRRLDGFQANCLRNMLGIKCSYISRVSNHTVLENAGFAKFSSTVREMQMRLLGQVISDPRKRELRTATFSGDSLFSQTAVFAKRVGRPRQNWTDELIKIMKKVAGSHANWLQAAGSTRLWSELSWSVIKNMNKT